MRLGYEVIICWWCPTAVGAVTFGHFAYLTEQKAAIDRWEKLLLQPEACMRQIEPDPTAMNRLMIGPDGAVHIIPVGRRKASPPAQQASESGCEDLPANVATRDTGLPGVRRVPGDGGVCFSYSVGMPITDRDVARRVLRDIRRGPGDGGICFSYSGGMRPSDRDAARRALRDVRQAPQGGICFSY
jgi:hypothetical protein